MGIKSGLRINPFARKVREMLYKFGSSADLPFAAIIRNLEELKVSYVFDIGANVGQFGLDMRRHGFKGSIISYEPVRETFGILTKTVIRYQPWKVFQLGLGATESEGTINVSGNSGLSSSMLVMKSLHLDNFPNAATVSQEKISISTIDKQLKILGLQPKEIMLKLDVQGFESEVIKGAADSLSKIPLCFLEVSISPLYEGEIALLPILNELAQYGHEVIEVFRGIKARDGRLLQIDILTKLSTLKFDYANHPYYN